MDIAHIGHVAVSGVRATTVFSTEIPAGMIGGYITFEFDPSWDGFTRHVTIEGSGVKTTLGVSDRVSVAKELIEYPNVRVKVGITGVSEDGSRVIPTMWAELGTTRPGAPTDLGGGTSDGGQESPIWAQIIGMIGDLNALGTEDRSNLVAAVNEVVRNGGGGAGGYYTPVVTQPTANTIKISFAPSVATMPAVEPVTINLPGSNSGQNGYVLPVGGDELGGVKNGGNVVINADGTMVAPEASTASIYAGDSAPTDGSLVWIDTTEDSAVVEIDKTAWVSGYRIGGSGGLESIASNTANEAVNFAFIPVEPGETYTLYNSADDTWASDTVYVGLYSDDTGNSSAYLGRVTGNPFKVTNKTAFILISSANLANGENYLKARLVKGTVIPEGGEDEEEPGGSGGNTGGNEGGGDTGGGETVGIKLNPDLWKPGYFSTSGSVTNSSSNGEMYYDEFIPVTPGETYYFYNTVEDWTTGWNGIMWYKADKTSLGRKQGTISGRYVRFTVSEETAYIKISCRNMTLYYETAVLQSYADFPAPEMPFESTEWTAGYYINDNGNAVAESSGGNCVTGLVSVEGGATYRFANSNPDWSARHIGVTYYSDIIPTVVDHFTYKQAFTSYDFTVPEGAKYIRLSSQNLTEMYTTATLTKIS